MARLVVSGFLALATVLAAPSLLAEPSAAEAFERAALALERGAYSEAIAELEALSDRGFVHPDASYNRGLAYAGRARTLQSEPGDLGRAAAGFAEAKLLRRGDDSAEHALSVVRAEIARRLSRSGGAPVMARPSLGRALVTIAPESAWAALAALGSLTSAVGLALNRWSSRYSARLSGNVALGVGLLMLTLGGALLAGAGHLRRTTTPAVVVVERARILDEQGRPIAAKQGETETVPEGAEVYVTSRRGGLSRVVWGTSEGWLLAGQLRELGAVRR